MGIKELGERPIDPLRILRVFYVTDASTAPWQPRHRSPGASLPDGWAPVTCHDSLKLDNMDIQKALLQNPVSREWPLETRKTYQSFYQRMTYAVPLAIKIGKGGLSFYKAVPRASVFVCHFNARPQGRKNDLGFADFRFDAIDPYLDASDTLQLFQKTASQEIIIKVNRLWCSLHFPLKLADDVANLFVQHIVSKVE
jgi:hypothetical protein